MESGAAVAEPGAGGPGQGGGLATPQRAVAPGAEASAAKPGNGLPKKRRRSSKCKEPMRDEVVAKVKHARGEQATLASTWDRDLRPSKDAGVLDGTPTMQIEVPEVTDPPPISLETAQPGEVAEHRACPHVSLLQTMAEPNPCEMDAGPDPKKGPEHATHCQAVEGDEASGAEVSSENSRTVRDEDIIHETLVLRLVSIQATSREVESRTAIMQRDLSMEAHATMAVQEEVKRLLKQLHELKGKMESLHKLKCEAIANTEGSLYKSSSNLRGLVEAAEAEAASLESRLAGLVSERIDLDSRLAAALQPVESPPKRPPPQLRAIAGEGNREGVHSSKALPQSATAEPESGEGVGAAETEQAGSEAKSADRNSLLSAVSLLGQGGLGNGGDTQKKEKLSALAARVLELEARLKKNGAHSVASDPSTVACVKEEEEQMEERAHPPSKDELNPSAPGAFLVSRAATRLQVACQAKPVASEVSGEYTLMQEPRHERPAYLRRDDKQDTYLFWCPIQDHGAWTLSKTLPGAEADDEGLTAHAQRLAQSIQATSTALPDQLVCQNWVTADGLVIRLVVLQS